MDKPGGGGQVASVGGVGERVAITDEWRRRPFSRREAVRSGFSDARLRGRDLERPFRGVRAVPGDDSLEARCRAYFALPRPGQAVSGATALALAGLPAPSRLSGAEIEIAVPLGTHRPKGRGVVASRVRPALWRESGAWPFPVLDPILAWLMLARRLQLDEAIVLADALLASSDSYPGILLPRPIATPEALADALEEFGSAPGARMLRSALELARPGSASPMETLARLAILRAGLPEPELNGEIFEGGEFLARGDLVFRAARTVVEYQGEHHRTDQLQFRRDIARRRRLVAAGWIVIEATVDDLRSGAAVLIRDLRRALARERR